MNRLRLPASRLALALLSPIVFAVSTFAQSTPTPPDGWVVLPVNEYTALKHAAAPAEPEPVAPPARDALPARARNGDLRSCLPARLLRIKLISSRLQTLDRRHPKGISRYTKGTEDQKAHKSN